MNQAASQTKYGQMKVTSFIIDQLNHVCRIIVQKRVQYITKENMLLLKDLLEP